MWMGALGSTAKDFGDVVTTWWPLFVAAATVITALWRYLLRPCYGRVTTFWARLEAALVQVEKLDKAFQVNGGSSALDLIRGTHHLSRLTAARVSYLQNFIERPMFEADHTGTFTRVNRSVEMITGYSNAELVGHGWINLVLPAERTRVVQEWEHAIEDRRSCVIETPVKTRSQRVVNIQITAFPVIDDATKELFSWLGELIIPPSVEVKA
jgi:PAS domain S-box-containing protein